MGKLDSVPVFLDRSVYREIGVSNYQRIGPQMGQIQVLDERRHDGHDRAKFIEVSRCGKR